MLRSRDGSGRDRGVVLPLVAIVLTTLIVFTSFALDLGYQRVRRRDMQAVADVVSLDLARLLDGSTANQLRSTMETQARVSATRNSHAVGSVSVLFGGATDTCTGPGDIAGNCLSVEMGTVDTSRVFTPLGSPCNSSTTTAGCVPNAVRVWAGTDVGYFFRPGSGDTRRSAVSTSTGRAQFEVGAFLASLGSTGLLQQIFNQNLGATVLSPSGVSNTTVSAGDIDAAIDAVKPNAAADTTLTAREFLLIAAKAAELGGDTANANVLNGAAVLAGQTATDLTVGDIADMYAQGDDAVAGGEVSLPGFIASSVMLMDGTHVLDLAASSITIPNTASPTAFARVVNPATLSAFGPVGTEAANQQLGLTLAPHANLSTTTTGLKCGDVAGSPFANLLTSTLACVLNPVTGALGQVASITLSSGSSAIDIVGAQAVGRLTNIDCSTNPSIDILPLLTPASLSTGVLSLSGTITIGTSGPQSFTVQAPLSLASTSSPPTQTFLDPSQFNVPRTVGSTNLNISLGGSVIVSTTPLGGALATALQPLLSSLVSSFLVNLATPLGTIASQLGVNLGGAQITARQRECRAPSLVG
jgi:hypothetical protein